MRERSPRCCKKLVHGLCFLNMCCVLVPTTSRQERFWPLIVWGGSQTSTHAKKLHKDYCNINKSTLIAEGKNWYGLQRQMITAKSTDTSVILSLSYNDWNWICLVSPPAAKNSRTPEGWDVSRTVGSEPVGDSCLQRILVLFNQHKRVSVVDTWSELRVLLLLKTTHVNTPLTLVSNIWRS